MGVVPRGWIAWPSSHIAGINGNCQPFAHLDAISCPESIGLPESILSTLVFQDYACICITGFNLVNVDQVFLSLGLFGSRFVGITAFMIPTDIQSTIDTIMALQHHGPSRSLKSCFPLCQRASAHIIQVRFLGRSWAPSTTCLLHTTTAREVP